MVDMDPEFAPQLHTIYRLQPPGISKKEWEDQLCKLTDVNPNSNNQYPIIFLSTRSTTTVKAKNLAPMIPTPFIQTITLNGNADRDHEHHTEQQQPVVCAQNSKRYKTSSTKSNPNAQMSSNAKSASANSTKNFKQSTSQDMIMKQNVDTQTRNNQAMAKVLNDANVLQFILRKYVPKRISISYQRKDKKPKLNFGAHLVNQVCKLWYLTTTNIIESVEIDGTSKKVCHNFMSKIAINFPNIRQLDIVCDEYSFSSKQFSTLAIDFTKLYFPKLQELDCTNVEVKNIHFDINNTPNLKQLNICFVEWTQYFYLNLPKLEEIYMEYVTINNGTEFGDSITRCVNLKEANFKKFRGISNICVKQMEYVHNQFNMAQMIIHPNLEIFRIYRSENLEAIGIWAPKLKEIYLQACYSVEYVELYDKLPKDFIKCHSHMVDYSHIKEIETKDHVQDIYFVIATSNINEKYLQKLQKHPRIQCLETDPYVVGMF